MIRLTSRDRRAIIVASLAVAPAVVYLSAMEPFRNEVATIRARWEAQTDALGREGALLAQARAFPSIAAKAESVLLREAPRLFDGTDPIVASAALAGYVTEQALRHRVFVQHSESRPADTAGQGVLALQVELRAAGDLQGLVEFLQALERGPKLVRVQRLAVERTERLDAGSARDEETLAIAAVVHGYALSPLEKPADSVQAP